MEFIAELFLSGFLITFYFGVSFGFITLFKKWNEGKYYKENEEAVFITSYFITLLVVLIMCYKAGKLLWGLLIILIIIAILMLLVGILKYKMKNGK